jgi:uncharacterized membrane protein YcaP (DUF421 family)
MDTQELVMTAGRAVLVYVVFLVIIRLLGKRTVGNITPFDLLIALILGEVVDEIIYGDVTLVQGFTAVIVVAVLHWLNSWFSFKSPSFDKLTAGSPTVLVKDGELQRDGMAQERMSEAEVWEELRLHEIDDLKEVKQACLETTGQVSVIRQEWAKELQKGDLPKASANGNRKAAEARP